MAWFMLEKNLQGITEELYRLKDLGYDRTPKHIEEAALFIKSNNFLLNPELNKVLISNETLSGFSDYILLLMKNPDYKSRKGLMVPEKLKKTYWYYLDFN
jgi:hypothetical protein